MEFLFLVSTAGLREPPTSILYGEGNEPQVANKRANVLDCKKFPGHDTWGSKQPKVVVTHFRPQRRHVYTYIYILYIYVYIFYDVYICTCIYISGALGQGSKP